MTIQLQNAINNAQTFEELVPIARKLEARLSFFGGHYVVIEPMHGEQPLDYTGSAPINELLTKIESIIKERACFMHHKYSPDENRDAGILENEISRIYDMSRENVNRACIITQIFLYIREFFIGGHLHHWESEFYGRDRRILWRVEGFIWDNDRGDYFEPRLQKTLTQFDEEDINIKWLSPEQQLERANRPPRRHY